MLSIAKNEHILEYNFFFYAIETFLDIYNFFYLLFYLNSSSFTLTMLFFLVQGFKLLSDFLLTKFSSYKQRGRLAKIFNEYNSILYEFIDNIRLIKSMCIEDIHLNKLYPLKNAITHEYCTLESILDPCIDFIHEVLDTFIVFVAGKYTIFDKINYSDLTIFQNYTNQLGTSFNSLKNIHRNYVDLFNLWKEFFEVYDYENKVISLKNYIPENENNFEFSIVFKNVKFAYPARPKAIIFNDLSLTIESGKKTAFVGYSGGGKSTLVALIQRLYDPLDGDIFLNNINLKDFNIKWLRNKIGFVSQDNILFSGTIKENIVFGLETYNEDHFKEVSQMENLDFVYDKSRFPNGFNTLVGERGSAISGGQKQRIAIARALMRDIKVLILDEATSSLDSKNEKEIQDSIDKISKIKNITTIIIAHRLSTVKNADVIMLMKKGNIVEKGTHDELLEKNGEYVELVKNQLIKTNMNIDLD
jgi:ABC-type multidrug transport system fused ATPase/permease subunit